MHLAVMFPLYTFLTVFGTICCVLDKKELELSKHFGFVVLWQCVSYVAILTMSLLLGISFKFHVFDQIFVIEEPLELRGWLPRAKDLTPRGLSDEKIASIPVFIVQNRWKGECVICLENLDANDHGKMLPNCGHVFHQECIDEWLNKKTSCPLCRGPVFSPNDPI